MSERLSDERLAEIAGTWALTPESESMARELIERRAAQVFDAAAFCRWADETFPASVPTSVVAHLRREVLELSAIVTDEDEVSAQVGGEIADCYMLLLHLCWKLGLDIEQCAREKYEVLKTRTWGEVDHEGVVEHIRDGAEVRP